MALFSRRKVIPEEAAEPTAGPPAISTVAELRPPRRRTVGQLLRETREGFGSDIPRVAAALRIRAAYLEAIEEGRYDRLPGPVYALGFVRAYAVHLGLDGDEAVRRFKLEAEGLEAQHDLAFPVPLAERSIPGFAMVLLAVILALCAYGLWYYLSSTARPRPERVAAVPAELVPPAPPAPPAPVPVAPQAAAAPAPAPSEALPPPAPVPPPPSPFASTTPPPAPAPPASAEVAPAPALPAVSEPSPAPAATAPPAAESVPAPMPSPPAVPPAVQTTALPDVSGGEAVPTPGQGHEYGAANGHTRVLIRALGTAWFRVADKDGKPVFTQTLQAGDIYHVPDTEGLTFKTGVAKNLAFFVDGHPAPSIGGMYRAKISLDPDRLMAGTAAE